jgi:hypothetical protein
MLKSYVQEFQEIYPEIGFELIKATMTIADFIITLPIHRLSLNQQQLDALGLLKDHWLRVEFSLDLKTEVFVPRLIAQIDESTLSIVPFPEEALFTNRLGSYCQLLPFHCLPHLDRERFELLRKVMTSFYCNEMIAKSTLETCRWDFSQTLLSLDLEENKQALVTTDEDEGTTPTTVLQQNLSPFDLYRVYLDELNTDPTQEALILGDMSDLHQRYPSVDLEALCALFKFNNYSLDETERTLKLNNLSSSSAPAHQDAPSSLLDQMDFLESITQQSPHFSRHQIHLTHPNKLFAFVHLLEGEIMTWNTRCRLCNQNLDSPGQSHADTPLLFSSHLSLSHLSLRRHFGNLQKIFLCEVSIGRKRITTQCCWLWPSSIISFSGGRYRRE